MFLTNSSFFTHIFERHSQVFLRFFMSTTIKKSLSLPLIHIVFFIFFFNIFDENARCRYTQQRNDCVHRVSLTTLLLAHNFFIFFLFLYFFFYAIGCFDACIHTYTYARGPRISIVSSYLARYLTNGLAV